MSKKPTTEVVTIETHSLSDIQDDDLVTWPVRLSNGDIAEIEETEEKPHPPRTAPKGQGKYDHIFSRMKLNDGGLKIESRQAAKAAECAFRTWLKKHKKEGKPSIQKWADGCYRLFWVSK